MAHDMTRSDVATLAAVVRESEHPTLPAESGWCLRYCRIQADIPAKYATAYLSAIHANPQPGAPPLGSFVYWRNADWQQGTAGHIAIADGEGGCWSTDIVRTGRFDLVPIGAIRSGWGLEYMGWSYTCNDIEISHASQGGEGEGDPLDMTPEECEAVVRKVLGSPTQGGTVIGDLQYLKGGVNARAEEIAELGERVALILQRIGSKDAGGTVLGDTQYIKEGVNAVNTKLDG